MAPVTYKARRMTPSRRRAMRFVMKLSTLLYSFSATAMVVWLYLFHSGVAT